MKCVGVFTLQLLIMLGRASCFSVPAGIERRTLHGLGADVCLIPSRSAATRAPLHMEGGFLAKVPRPSLPQLGYGALLYTSGQGIVSDIVSKSFDRPVLLDVFIFVVSGIFLIELPASACIWTHLCQTTMRRSSSKSSIV